MTLETLSPLLPKLKEVVWLVLLINPRFFSELTERIPFC